MPVQAPVSPNPLRAASCRAAFSPVKPRLAAPQQTRPFKLRQTALLTYSGDLRAGSCADDSGLSGEIEQTSSADKAEEFP